MSKIVKTFAPRSVSNSLFFELQKKLQNAVNEFDASKESKIDSIFIAIFINTPLSLDKHTPSLEQNSIKLYSLPFNKPGISPKLANELEISQMVLRGKIDFILQKTNYKDSDEVNSVSIVLGYNKVEADFKKLILSKNANEDEVLPFRVSQPKYRLDSVILSDQQLNDIEQILVLLKNFDLIYLEWGFIEIDKNMRTILNFFGASGTGKTMTAHAIANELGKKIMSLNYSEIESKYVGDAPKNLMRAFDEAKVNDAVLFFDEADSFLGKRISNVSHSSDQAINSLRSQMLILLDDFEGLVIFATNMIENYDKAFNSRIMSHLHFELPDSEMRMKLIRQMIPPRMQYENDETFSDLQVSALSDIAEGFSGREIKNTILNSLTCALKDKRKFVTFQDFESSFINQKNVIEKINKSGKKVTISPELKKSIEDELKVAIKSDDIEETNKLK